MKKLLFNFKTTGICALLTCVVALTANAQEVITLQKAVDLALTRNLTVKQSQFNEAFDQETLNQSKNNRLPNLSASTSPTVNFGRNIDFSTNQFVNQRVFGFSATVGSQIALFQGFQLKNQIIENKILLDADKSATAKVKNDLVLNVVTTFLQVLSNQDLVVAAKQQMDISKLAMDRTEKSFKVGNLTQADLSQAKAQISTAELNQVNAENQLESSLLALKQYMEMDPATNIKVERPDISKLTNVKTTYDPQEVFTSALRVNPDVLLADIRKNASAQNIKIAKGAYYPSLVLFGQLGTNYSDARLFNGSKYQFFNQLSDNFNQALGVSLQIPIFTRFNTRTNVRKAQITYQNAEVTAQLAKNNLNKIIYQAVWDLQASQKQYQSSLQTYQANKDAFNVIQQRYNVGLVNSLDYNTSLTNLNKSQFDMIQAQYMVVFRSKVIDYYLGNPIIL
ncbi:TolC family protein [Mucilaginibacter boryungensis]|uniref:TolC family protein n=1 Tax=Mucilaginibacter boryungensis TaxID=768480 RepID=A0ABR9XDB7_9SPHI|nr:TolC family protein [Mucilaginibacter boryungensis]MBE9664969.1 TolC family protein [Mucilaginibacter boryungensis]